MTKQKCQFKVFYQPLVCLVTGQIAGFEALVRWQHPALGSISPADFIPIAEDTGTIVTLGNWVLKTAIKQLKFWQQDFASQLSEVKMAVNISGKQLLQLDLVQQIEKMLQETELHPKYLKLEITESVLMENFELAMSILTQLNQLGIELAIDDFGTGYSSLGRLQNLPIDTLKIDRCFVREMDYSTEKLTMVRAIASLAHNLKLNIVVEGIETTTQLAILKDLNCHQGQGYYFAKPLSAESITTLLANQFHWSHHFIDVAHESR